MISYKNHLLAAISNGNKNRLRKSAISERLNLKEKFIERNSIKISNELLKNFSLLNKNVHLFYPITKNKEVNTWYIHKAINSNSIIFTSFYEKTKERWECISFNPSVKFTNGKLNIPVPIDYKLETFDKIEVILVPLLVFDKFGNRIGYGKGIYDSILTKLNKNCLKIGLSFFEVSKENIQVDFYDQSLDYCQTPNQLYKFK
ncbi:MAG: 5-formyltetrahydrofolate cyclo-ligase [Crocinitomicaceae bacterium]|nr:5-formyltetrahydrofolate cyclo-ligase [Crocinitomicaceae bacterium]